ncbi:hypothetical protein AB1Y20_010180 [Prymnesium parvum]|uniref:Amino acid transporter transmembrane domain-containing protein n=1 Tax=Prymnesium parvum TaxID=97485 RepID=A0AB34K6N2_PRYPA
MKLPLLLALAMSAHGFHPPLAPRGRRVAGAPRVGRLQGVTPAGDGELYAEKQPASSGGATVGSSMINLVKAIVGSGVLSLPVGVAAFTSSRGAVPAAVAVMALITALSAYCFAMVARVCEATRSQTWGEAWRRTVGESSAWVPSCFVSLLCFSASLQYTMVIGDSFSAIFTAAGLPRAIASRRGAIGAVTMLGTLPLSLLPNLDMLKYTSFLGIGGLLYTAAFMIARVGSYVPGAALHAAAAIPPSFSAEPFKLSMMLQPKMFVLVSILATAFCAHFIAPQFYNELADTKDGSSKMPAFNLLTAGGFVLSAALSAVFMGAGYMTFGGASNGYILNNYATTDRFAQAARLAIGGSIVTTYPLLHQGLRDTVVEVLGTSRVMTSIGCVGLITLLGMKLTNLGTVAAVSGALVSTSLVYVLPAIMFGQMLKQRIKSGMGSRRLRVELAGSRVVAVIGVFLVAIGMHAAFS